VAGPDDGGARSPGRSFGSVATGYAAQRPGYPAVAVTHLLGRGGGPQEVLDVGAGTGLRRPLTGSTSYRQLRSSAACCAPAGRSA
jgi:hypothetical protein